MEKIQINTENLKKLRKTHDILTKQLVYDDRVEVAVIKIPMHLHTRRKRRRYRYSVEVKCVFNKQQYTYETGFPHFTKAIKYAEEIFRIRNNYMLKHNYYLQKEGGIKL